MDCHWQVCKATYRVIKKFLCTWWLQYKIDDLKMAIIEKFGMWTMLYWTSSLRTQFGVSINVWGLVGDTLNSTHNSLCHNHQVHRDFLIILHIVKLRWILSLLCANCRNLGEETHYNNVSSLKLSLAWHSLSSYKLCFSGIMSVDILENSRMRYAYEGIGNAVLRFVRPCIVV
jgi:hypothetical protein